MWHHLALELGMPVCEAQERIPEAEFVDWQLFFEHRNDMADRQRQGLPMHDSDSATELTPEQSAEHVTAVMNLFSRKQEAKGT